MEKKKYLKQLLAGSKEPLVPAKNSDFFTEETEEENEN